MTAEKTSLTNFEILIQELASSSADYLQTVLVDYASLARVMMVHH